MMSLPSANCTSTVDSGVNRCASPSRCERNSTPSSVTLAQIAQAEDLEAARVGEDRARPGHELVQTAQLADQLVAGTQKQVIGVGQDDLGVEFVGQVALQNAFDGGLRAHRHEDRRFDDAVRGVEQSGARAGVGALGLQLKTHYLTVARSEA